LFFLAIVAFANLSVFLSIGTVISTALMVIIVIVSIFYIQQVESHKEKADKDKLVYSSDAELFKKYLENIAVGILALNRNREIMFINNFIPDVIRKDLKNENPSFEHFWKLFYKFLDSENSTEEYDFTLGEKGYTLKFHSFSPYDEENIMIVFADKKEKNNRDINRVYKKFWNFLKVGPISVLNNYLITIRDNVNEIGQDIFLTDNSRQQIDNMIKILDRSRDDVDNLSLMVNTNEKKLEDMEVVDFFKKIANDLSVDKDYVKIKIINSSKSKIKVKLNKEHTQKIIKNISDNVTEYTKSKKLDIEFISTYEVGTDNKAVEIRFISPDAKIKDDILNGLGKGIKTSQKGKHLGLGLEIVKKLTIVQGGNIEFRKASNGFTIALTFRV